MMRSDILGEERDIFRVLHIGFMYIQMGLAFGSEQFGGKCAWG
jgi:hypothetical protein